MRTSTREHVYVHIIMTDACRVVSNILDHTYPTCSTLPNATHKIDPKNANKREPPVLEWAHCPRLVNVIKYIIMLAI